MQGDRVMKIGVFIALSLIVLATLLPVACTGSEATTTPTTTKTPPTTTPTTIRPTTEPPTEEELRALGFFYPELPRITSYQLKSIMDRGDPLLVVDVRLGANYDLGHLPNALNITVSCGETNPEADELAAVKLMALPRDRLIVLY